MKKRILCIVLILVTCLFAACSQKENYTGQWLDKESASKGANTSKDFIITEIYADCFFAEDTRGYVAKFNGDLAEFWCVGDPVYVTYENTYFDVTAKKMEADVIKVESGNRNTGGSYDAKPVIYLYPEEETEVSVKLEYAGRLTCTYPAYNHGWQVIASPDGTLTDPNGQVYNYLYWEGISQTQWDMTKGFCVKGADTAAFLEEALEKQGLNRREANEFIVYWLPLMQENPYNIIAFQTDVYTDAAKLEIIPAPDTLIRLFMAWKPSETEVVIPAQELTAPERTGFTAIEWGGTELN